MTLATKSTEARNTAPNSKMVNTLITRRLTFIIETTVIRINEILVNLSSLHHLLELLILFPQFPQEFLRGVFIHDGLGLDLLGSVSCIERLVWLGLFGQGFIGLSISGLVRLDSDLLSTVSWKSRWRMLSKSLSCIPPMMDDGDVYNN